MAKAFLVQYKHMTDTAPDRMLLQNMKKKASETFREYVNMPINGEIWQLKYNHRDR